MWWSKSVEDEATTVLWFIPILVTIHNLEEALLVRMALNKLLVRIPEQFRGFIPIITCQQILIAVRWGRSVAMPVPIVLLVPGPGLIGLMEVSGWISSQL